MKRTTRRLTGVFCLLATLIILSPPHVFSADPVRRILIIPLTVHSEKNMDFLNQGIMDMLASRISQAATVIRKNEIAPGRTPIQMGRDIGADYVITGSLTLFGNSASTDAVLTEVKTGESSLQFNQFGQSGGDVLMHIDQFAQQVSRFLVTQSATPGVAAPVDAAPAMMVPQTAPPVVPVPPSAPTEVPAPTAPIVANEPAAGVTPEVPATQQPETEDSVDSLWTGNPIKGVVSALTTGDVNGDGTPDIVYAHKDRIVVDHLEGNRLNRLATMDTGRNHKVIAVDIGNINGNNFADIFVTRLNPQGRLDSMVLEWNGTSLASLAGGQRWYFRIGGNAENGPVLMGQRQGTPMANDTGGLYESSLFLPGVFELTWNGKACQAGPQLSLPRDMTVYRFTQGDLFNDGNKRTIAYTDSDRLRIYDPAGDPQWISSERFGGNPLFLESASSTDVRSTDRTYLTQRLILADLDADGKVELVTVRNRDAARGLVERFRVYNRGRVVVLRWNKVDMKEVWSGEEINGYISDFSLADLNADGRQEVVYAMVGSTGLARTQSSNIVVERIGDLSGK